MGKGRITLDMRPVEERKMIARKGAIASNKAQKEKKEKLKQRKTIVETLKDVLYTNVTNKNLIKMLKSKGSSQQVKVPVLSLQQLRFAISAKKVIMIIIIIIISTCSKNL